MSLEKAIHHGKEKRRPYPGRDSRNFDWSCRNHRGCPWCESSRLRQRRQQEQDAREEQRRVEE